jgi:hypothetical protein
MQYNIRQFPTDMKQRLEIVKNFVPLAYRPLLNKKMKEDQRLFKLADIKFSNSLVCKKIFKCLNISSVYMFRNKLEIIIITKYH